MLQMPQVYWIRDRPKCNLNNYTLNPSLTQPNIKPEMTSKPILIRLQSAYTQDLTQVGFD